MVERIYEYFLTEPRRLMSLGKNMVRAGGFILVIGAIGHSATAALSAVQSLGRQVAVPRDLAQLYPAFPTWWIPESLIGCLPAILLMILGFSLVSFGERLKRAYF